MYTNNNVLTVMQCSQFPCYNLHYCMRVNFQTKKIDKKPPPKAQTSNWDALVNKLIRPPRHQYKETQLGPTEFQSKKETFHRDEEVILHQGKKIMLTMITPSHKNYKIILYLHGNSSCKVQSLSLLPFLPPGFSLASFDFMGCGNNEEAELISLGVRESQQIATVVRYLRSRHYEVILWGRSMGAASALKYGKVDIIVADSSFRSMKKLCKEFAKNNKPKIMPECLVGCLFPCVFRKLKSDIQERADFDLQDLNIEEEIKNISPTTTIIFIWGEEDTLINQKHCQRLYDNFRGQNKYMEVVKGGHNSKRPPETMKKAMDLIAKHSKEHNIMSDGIGVDQIGIRPNFE